MDDQDRSERHRREVLRRGQALEYEGTIFISDGADDVFAINAHSGHRL